MRLSGRLLAGPMLVFALSLGIPGANAQTSVPKFADYPVNERFQRKTPPVVLSGEARMFHTRLRDAARGKPNFAGHYIVVTWGCGTECIEGAIIDARSGRVFMLPFSLCCWAPGTVDDNFKPVDFRLNSSLIVLTGERDERDGDYATRYYRYQNNRLALVKAVPT
ncbi:MAG: hypothetical protein AABM67_11495 [Acidobacteriota bacterium]